jgi:hypothetical protein
MVGRITGAHTFDPKFAMIVQNKDDLRIPLLLETIPTPKEFADAIASLSPEQQRFCKGFRAMQLESTLFGVCVIQIKPALEKVLNLPDDSLTKEIALTQDLLKLFLEYQIPSDQLSYAPDAMGRAPAADMSTAAMVGFVRQNVAKMMEITEVQKLKELAVPYPRSSLPFCVLLRSADRTLHRVCIRVCVCGCAVRVCRRRPSAVAWLSSK